MTRTLTTEQLRQIKADIAARKAMPEYGESIEGNIERLRVIGATRSHFSTETVEMLVRALEEKSRALADAERERDDWVEHSRRMEHRAIEAKELLANREAQPSITDEAIDRIVVPLSPEGLDEEKHHCEWHLYHDRERIRKELREYFAAPPAPAVPDGFKLVPTVPTPEMIAAAMNCDDVTFNADETFCVNFGNIYAAMVAAVPEGGNDHDTRR